MSNSVFKLNFQGQISLSPARLDQNLAEDSTVRLVNQIVDKLDFTDIEKTYAGGDFIVSSANDAKSAVLCLHEQHLFVPENRETIVGKHSLHVAFGESNTRFQDHQQLSFAAFEGNH
jgi:hypothetical protein